MKYEDTKTWKDTDFKRFTGVRSKTFAKMLAVLEKELPKFGRPPKLSRADQLLLTLMYWREYRTQFHIAGSYGISEAMVCRTINKVEDAPYAFRRILIARQESTSTKRHTHRSFSD